MSRPFPNLTQTDGGFIRRNINAPIENFLSFFNNEEGSFASGSFEYTNGYDPRGNGPPDYINRPFIHYYNTLCDFCYALPHAPKWAVFIEPHSEGHLLNELGKMRQYEPSSSSEDWNVQRPAEYLMRDDAQKVIGCIFALSVTEAGGSVGIGQYGGAMGANNGFLKAPVTQGRSDNEPLEITFKETNCSYVDFVLNPWMKLIGHKGLVARPKTESLKADIRIFELAPTFAKQSPIVRKVYHYHDCAPISVPIESLNYEADRVIQKQVQFIYNHYTIQDGSGFGADNAFEAGREDNANWVIGQEHVYGEVDPNGK